ncbi:F-box protein SKIP24 isoform X2 [Arabidopsis lyrata subsp. lyrata]|uniref:F-box protein SKIP24 isoform X2 n=1 Tax=Arabidopsis lyrata subsp. lyrata TaxID=81972 RepID=UPI000A29E9D3|nr:F-box protein SKIP24 isoform X2 [Arabidopsis lyrata subsp. lyrata]|eukprot:XP_020869694.1 F-box protein SKIP24 isoform X2 [Arabidopsis lyrata subsp. lyrata]
MSANEIPDEIWRKIMEIGVKSSTFSYKDLCCISISSRRLCRLSCDDSLWDLLLFLDFPTHIVSASSSQSPSKFIYRTRFEREKERKVAAHRRALLRKESEISEWGRRIRELEARLSDEAERLHSSSLQFSDLLKVRQASVALNVWQPQIVRGRQKQLVEQNAVPVEGRLRALEMEIKLCKQQIMGVNKALREVKHRFDIAIKELESMKYHPLRDYKSSGDQGSNGKTKKLKTSISYRGYQESNGKRKKLKTSINSVQAIPKHKEKLFHAESE